MAEPRVDPRIERTRTAVLDAAFAVIGEVGFAGATIDAISRRSGVARSTIYRHWSDRDDLLVESMSRAVGTVGSVATGSLRDDLVALALQIGAVLAAEPIGSVIASVLLESRRDPALDRLRSRFVEHRRAEGRRLVADAIRRGELPGSIDPLEVAEALAARVLFRAIMLREPTDPRWAAEFVDGLLARYSSVAGNDA